MNDKLARMIWLQAGLERELRVHNFAVMSPKERVRYIRDQHQLATAKLYDALMEVDWNPEKTDSHRSVHRDHFIIELIDGLAHWINMILAVSGDATPREVADEIFTRFALWNSAVRESVAAQQTSEEVKK